MGYARDDMILAITPEKVGLIAGNGQLQDRNLRWGQVWGTRPPLGQSSAGFIDVDPLVKHGLYNPNETRIVEIPIVGDPSSREFTDVGATVLTSAGQLKIDVIAK